MSLHKEPVQQKESIKTCVRIKPILSPNEEKVFYLQDSQTIVAKSGAKFTYNHVFDDKSSTDYIYEIAAKPIIHQALRGFNGNSDIIAGCIMAYGQTSSGKTHTMKGTLEYPGIVPLALSDIFETIKAQEISAKIQVSYLEIYNQRVFDLLADSNNMEIEIRMNDNNNLSFTYLKEHRVESFEKALGCFNKGEEKRKFASNNLNVNSSRSHTIFRISINICLETFEELKAQIDLVDLAGSESLENTKNEKISRTQGENINKSLLALSKIITLLSEKKDEKYICFRQSKLTRILQKSLCQNSKSSIICMINPTNSNYQESLNTLKFGQNALKIKIQARQNINRTETLGKELYLGKNNLMPSERIELQEARQTIKQNQFYIRELNQKVSELEHQNYKLFTSMSLLERQHNDIQEELKNYKEMHQAHASQWWKHKQMFENRIKNYQQEMELLQARYQEVKRELRTVEKNQKSLVESLAHYENQCKHLNNQIKDIAYQVKEQTNKVSKRKQQKEPLFKEKPKPQPKKNPFFLPPYKHDPDRERIQPNKLAWVFRLKNQVIELSRKVNEYTKANIEIAQENEQLRRKIDQLEDKREKQQITGKINPEALEYQEIKRLKRKIVSLREQLKLSQVNEKKYRDILKKDSTRNLVQMEEYEEWYEKKYGGSFLETRAAQTDLGGQLSLNFLNKPRVFSEIQESGPVDNRQKMEIEQKPNPFMSAVGKPSPTKSERLNNNTFKKETSVMKTENPELMKKSFNGKIPFSKSITEYENIDIDIDKKPNQGFQSLMEDRDSMLLEDTSSENQDFFRSYEQNIMRNNGNSRSNNGYGSNFNQRNILTNQPRKNGGNIFDNLLPKKKEESKDIEI